MSHFKTELFYYMLKQYYNVISSGCGYFHFSHKNIDLKYFLEYDDYISVSSIDLQT
jgi:hypothetical protein